MQHEQGNCQGETKTLGGQNELEPRGCFIIAVLMLKTLKKMFCFVLFLMNSVAGKYPCPLSAAFYIKVPGHKN